jgi:hypothetical protein
VARDDHKPFVLAVWWRSKTFGERPLSGGLLAVASGPHAPPLVAILLDGSFCFGVFSCSSLVVKTVCFVLINLVFAFRPKCVTDSLFSSSFYVTAEASFWLAKFYL